MKNFKNTNKKLFNSYKKRLKALIKAGDPTSNPLGYFIEYLKMLRDYYLLTSEYCAEISLDNFELASLTTAISEYEKSQTCISNYYKIENGTNIRIAEGTEEEVMERYSKERAFHWESFWKLVAIGFESWVAIC